MPSNIAEESLGGTSSSPSSSSVKLRKRPDALLVTCRIFSVFTALSAVFCIVVNVFSAIRSFEDGSDIFDGVFRCYAVVIACFVVLAETEWSFIIKFWKVLEYWVGRGMLQIFVGVMTRAFPNYYTEKKELVFIQNLASYLLIACGGVYVISAKQVLKVIGHIYPASTVVYHHCIHWLAHDYILATNKSGEVILLLNKSYMGAFGVLCLGFLKRSRQQKEITRDQAFKEIEELERRREELQHLLIVERA